MFLHIKGKESDLGILNLDSVSRMKVLPDARIGSFSLYFFVADDRSFITFGSKERCQLALYYIMDSISNARDKNVVTIYYDDILNYIDSNIGKAA